MFRLKRSSGPHVLFLVYVLAPVFVLDPLLFFAPVLAPALASVLAPDMSDVEFEGRLESSDPTADPGASNVELESRLIR